MLQYLKRITFKQKNGLGKLIFNTLNVFLKF